MLWLIGLGLFDEKDVSVRGLEVIRECDSIFLENYTSILHVPVARLEEFYGKPVRVADREMVESYADEILDAAAKKDAQVAFLVVGDPFGATTHADLLLRAEARGIAVRTIHNASIMNAVAACGLQLYAFGQTVSIPFFTANWRPRSFYPRIVANHAARLHTLCLLDIKVKEISEENLCRGRRVFEPPRFMTVNEALIQLQEVEEAEEMEEMERVAQEESLVAREESLVAREESLVARDETRLVARDESLVVALVRIGAPDQVIRAGTIAELVAVDFGAPLHALVIPGPELHELEYEMLRRMHMAEDSALKHVSFQQYKSGHFLNK